jgi:predicted RNA methylase
VPELVNDPTGSPWEAVVYEAPGAVRVELVPNVPDPRFAYRTGDVPAASHPTIAAALVRAAGPRPGDVVWDPFAGSGMELCERALAGPYRSLVGSDLDAAALAVARANLEAAGAREVTLIQGDATRLRPPGPAPTLIITNPPLGRRVQRSAALGPLLDRFVEHASGLLAPGGRISWISPFPARTRTIAGVRGLTVALAREVDLGGFPAELQVLVRQRKS